MKSCVVSLKLLPATWLLDDELGRMDEVVMLHPFVQPMGEKLKIGCGNLAPRGCCAKRSAELARLRSKRRGYPTTSMGSRPMEMRSHIFSRISLRCCSWRADCSCSKPRWPCCCW